MRRLFKLAVMGLSLVTSFPIFLLNWVAPIVAIVWLLVIHAWQVVLIGLIAGFIAKIVFGLMVGMVPVAKTALGQKTFAARCASFVLSVVLFMTVLLYSSEVFSFAERTGLPTLPMALWAYGTAGSPWVAIVRRTQHNDPMSIIWPSVAQTGSMAKMVALLCGSSTDLQSFILIAGCFTGLLFGWVTGSHRISMLARERPMPRQEDEGRYGD